MDVKFTVDGQTYHSLDEMPPDVRRAYSQILERGGQALADRDGNGIPDALEGKSGPMAQLKVTGRIVVNGRSYGSADEMPAEDRSLYESAMRAARNHEGPKVSVTHHEARLTIGAPFGGRAGGSDPVPSPPPPGAIEPAGFEAGIRTLLISIACLVAVAAVWVLLRR